jgi:hypothetical protein
MDSIRNETVRAGAPAVLLAAFALVLSTALPAVQALSQPAGGKTRPPRPPVDVVLDANDDGVIDQGEIANAAVALKKLDANKDGKLTRDELHPKRPGETVSRGPEAPPQGRDGRPPEGAGRPKRPQPPVITALDASGDGVIDAKEIAAAPAALKKLDANGDGRLSPDEYRPLRPDDGAALPSATPGLKRPR